MKIYIAGALFSSFEREFLEQMAALCERLGHETFLPHRDAGFIEEGDYTAEETRAAFNDDVNGVKNSEVVLALLNGPDVDSGTAWEIGYAYAQGKKIIGFVTDSRMKRDMNIMPMYSCVLVFSFEELEEELKKL